MQESGKIHQLNPWCKQRPREACHAEGGVLGYVDQCMGAPLLSPQQPCRNSLSSERGHPGPAWIKTPGAEDLGTPVKGSHRTKDASYCPQAPQHPAVSGTQGFSKDRNWPWPVWLSGLSAGVQTEMLPVQFPVRAQAWVARVRQPHIDVSVPLSLPPSLPLSLKINK